MVYIWVWFFCSVKIPPESKLNIESKIRVVPVAYHIKLCSFLWTPADSLAPKQKNPHRSSKNKSDDFKNGGTLVMFVTVLTPVSVTKKKKS